MATELCQKCQKAHPGRTCDYDDKGNCVETVDVNEIDEVSKKEFKDKKDVD